MMVSPLLSLRFSIRQLRKSPGFAFTAILTLALGIGAAVSVFSVVNAVLLKPFSFRDPARLVVMRETAAEIRSHELSIPDNYRHYLRLKKDTRTLEDAAIFEDANPSVSTGADHPRIVHGIAASANFFHVLGVQTLLGRDFIPKDTEKGAPPVVILTYEGWKTFFNGDPGVIGKTLRTGGDSTTVVGVLTPDVRVPDIVMASFLVSPSAGMGEPQQTMLFEPLTPTDRNLQADTGNFNFKVIARLKPGVTLSQARAELNALQRAYSLSAHLPDHLGIALTPLARDVTSNISSALWLLFASVGAVLLIACANLANLQLARSVAAERETAVRAALGASRAQLLMVRLTESFLLAAIGGIGGVALAFAGVRLLIAVAPANVPRLTEAQVNVPVLAFAVGLSLLTAVLFGILPALHSLRAHPQAALQANASRTASSQNGNRTRGLLVAGEVACTVVLLVITGLVLRSFSNLLRENRGFDTGHVTAAQVDLFAPQYGDSHANVKAVKIAFIDRALASLGQLPGVQLATLTSAMPLTGETWVDDLTRSDRPLPPGQRPMINIRWIDPGYIATMRIPLVAGRNFTAADRKNPYVALISQKTARKGFPGEDPIGKKITDAVPDDDHLTTVIGVVSDNRVNGLRDTSNMVYMPYWAYTPWSLTFLVRSSQRGDALIPQMRQVLWNIDPQIAIPTIKSLDDQVSDSVATDRFQTLLLSSFGAAALLLALLGVYGVLAYSVSLRSQEFGIRIALGSDKGRLMLLVLRQAAWPVFAGAGVGLILSFIATRWVRSLLYQTQTADPLAIAGSLGLLVATAAFAAILPARRAARVDPIEVLRAQ